MRVRSIDEGAAGRLANALRVRSATARCLVARGVTEPSAAQGFIDPRLAALRPPVELAGMTDAVTRLADAVVRGERIGVFGDYDVDGVTTAALLTSFLRDSGAEVACAVARRDAGYGFTTAAAADFAARGCAVVVTGDCGTNDLDAIYAGAALGLEVIVVDHHTVPAAGTVHPALSLVNPFRPDSKFPFRGMASVGLMFYVAASVRTELRDRGWYRTRPEPDVRELLDLVALGTIADLVPLSAENRILTSLGLRRLQARARPGVAALLAAAGVGPDREVDARTVAWKIAPRINAPGRLGAAEPALQLLLATGAEAEQRAAQLEGLNAERRAIQQRVLDEALSIIEAKGGEAALGPAIVLAGEGWPHGVVGIVAAKLVDKYARPAFVIGVDPETGTGRGSARTVKGINLYDALEEAAPWLDKFGGHAAAAGFTVRRENVAAIHDALGAAVGRVTKLADGSGPTRTAADADIDAEVRLGEVDERLAQELASLGPFGQDNPAPLLGARSLLVTSVRRVGDGAHLRLTLDDGTAIRSAIGFRLGDREVGVGARVDLAFVPTVSTWQGQRSAELEVADLAVVS
jgi:single-stranded-DNA-specific exonuclease|nr:single-stranded-DNA-specific exonuclease RecJ [Kofleriaceae bacterium]